MKKLTTIDVVRLREQLIADQMKWALSVTTDQQQLIGYQAGLQAGIDGTVAHLRLHGYLAGEGR